MNKTKIDWCDSTWNPVTGCLHNCEYCYARGIANRFKERNGYELNEDNTKIIFHFDGSPTIYEVGMPCFFERLEDLVPNPDNKIKAPYPYGFSPTFHKYRLNDYIDKHDRNIFVCSMADLFGEWVPDEWIEEIFKACTKASQHNYLFLTKNPVRYEWLRQEGILIKSDNMWYGYSSTRYGDDYWYNSQYNTFVSIEPILEPMGVPPANWVIVGAETGKRKGKVIPKREWIEIIVEQCKDFGIPLFMKSSLADIWGEPLIQEFPEELKIRLYRNN